MLIASIKNLMFSSNKTGPLEEVPPYCVDNQASASDPRDPGSCGETTAAIKCPFHKSLICCMAIFGLFNPRNFNEICGKFTYPTMAYSCLVVLFVVVTTIRLLATAFDEDDDFVNLFNKINNVAWFGLCSFNVSVFCYMSFVKKGGIRKYYEKIRAVLDGMSLLGVPMPWKNMWKIELLCIAGGSALVITNTTLVLSQLFDDQKFELMKPLCRLRPANSTTESEIIVMRYVMAVAFTLASGCWIWPVVYIMNIALHLGNGFDGVNKHMKKLVTSDPAALLRGIGGYRQLHRSICKCVEAADRYFKYVIGVHIILYLLLSMLELYNIAQFQNLGNGKSNDLYASYVIWLTAALAMLIIECAASSWVAHKSQETAEPLYRLADGCGELDNRQLFQVQLFLSQLQSPSGFNVMGLFVLSKDGLLAIAGTWVTYFLIVLQFAPPKEA